MSEKVTKGLVMKETIGTPMTFEEYRGQEERGEEMLLTNAAEEFEWLMSLALDGELDTGEAARFEALLRREPANQERWLAWQALDNDFQQIPYVLPPLDFGEKLALRLELQERRRRLRTGIIFGLAAVLLWGSILAGVGMLGALVWSNQAVWLSGIVHNFAYWWAGTRQFGQALLDTVEALWSAPETRALLVCYVGASLAILVAWFWFLRRSTHELPINEAQLVEA
jgi:hypothetical protein